MKLRFLLLLPELILLGFFVAPLSKRIWNAGNLAGIGCCLALVALTLFPGQIAGFIHQIWQHLLGKIGLSLLALCVAFGVVFCGAMSLQMARAMANTPNRPATVVVLGCKVRGTTPSLMLTRRLETALDYLQQNPAVMCITAGGQGPGEDLPEGIVMRDWLVAHGIAPARILVDDTSKDTHENIENAKALLLAHGLDQEIVLVTDGFHQYRAQEMAREQGLSVTGCSAKTRALYVPTYWVREWMALFELQILHRA